MTLLLFCIGLLAVEGDEHKHLVHFSFQDLFANCCLILLQVAQDFLVSYVGLLKCQMSNN